MSTPRTPSKRNLARVPSMGSSFASCFGASTPISPRRTGGHGLLGGQACVNYRRLGFDEDEDERTLIYEATAKEEEDAHARYEHGKHFCLREEGYNGMHYASEGEEHHARERKTAMKLGTPGTMRERASMECFYASEAPKGEEPYASEQEGDEHVRERKVTRKFAKLWSMREKDTISYASETPKKQVHYHAADEAEEAAGVYVRERKGLMKLAKLWTMREKGRRETCKEVHHASEESDECGRERSGEVQLDKHVCMREREGVYAGGPMRRESLSRKVREACVQVLESARRSSPHMSELFVGNQLLMQVTSSSVNARRPRNVAPSAGFLVTGDPPLSVVSPPRSSSSSAF